MQQLTTQQNEAVPEDAINIQPAYVQISDHLGSRIKRGEWKPEVPLPSEVELAKQYRCALGTIRNALDILKANGALISKKGRGTYVNDQEAADAKRRHACVGESLHIIREAIDESGSKNVPAKLQTSLQTRIADALLKAGFSGEATP